MTHFRARQVSYIFGLLLLCIYIFALLGMQMFAGQYAFDAHGYHVGLHERVVEGVSAEIPRANFDTLLWVRGSRTRLHGIFERAPQTIANDGLVSRAHWVSIRPSFPRALAGDDDRLSSPHGRELERGFRCVHFKDALDALSTEKQKFLGRTETLLTMRATTPAFARPRDSVASFS